MPVLTPEEAKALGLDDEPAPASAPAPSVPPPAMGGSPNYNPPPAAVLSSSQATDLGLDEPEPSAWDQVKNFAVGTAETMGRQVRAADRGLRQALPWSEEASAAAGAIDPFTGEAGTFSERYARHLAEERGADDKAAEESPGFFYGTQIVGGAALPGASSIKLAANAGKLAKVGKGAAILGEGAFYGAGASRADTAEGVLEDAALGAGANAAFAGLSKVASGGTKKLLGDASPAGEKGVLEKGYEAEMRADITAGANPTHARRAMPDRESADMMIDWVERTKDVKKAVGGPREKVAEVAGEHVEKLAAKTAPVYPKFDEAAGTIPTWEIADHFDDAINTLKRSHANNSEGMVQALEAGKAKILGVARERGEDFLTHQDVRAETSNLLREKQRTVGAIAETPLYVYKNEVHQVADQFLRERMEVAAAIQPSLAKDLKQLRLDNRDLSSALRLEAVANNADQLDMWKAKPPSKQARSLVERGAPTSVAGGLAGGPAGVLLGAAAPPLAEALTKRGMLYLGQIARARRMNQETAGLVRQAIDAGVPPWAARAAISIGAKESGASRTSAGVTTEESQDPAGGPLAY